MAGDTEKQGEGSVFVETGFEGELSLDMLLEWAGQIQTWIVSDLLTWQSLIQLTAIAAGFFLAMATRGWCSRLIDVIKKYVLRNASENELRAALTPVLFALVWLMAIGFGRIGFELVGLATPFAAIAMNLLAAWVVIRLASSVIGEPFWAGTVAVIAWSVAALNISGLLDPTLAFLDGFAITVAGTRVSILFVVQSITLVIVLVWGASLLSRLLQRRIDTLPSLTPSVRLLIGNVVRIALIALALFIGLTSLGIDLSVLAVFGGAIGIGVGFGLQKIVGNFVSGLILLLDRSIKPGDVIEVGETYGRIKSLGARYTSVVTRDGHEYLVPNEDFIVNTVTNWSFSDRFVRVRRTVGVSYNADIRLAQKLIVEAAMSVNRVLKMPEPRCLLKGFGDSSVDLEVRFWITDPEDGVSNVSSEVLFAIWDKFQEHKVEIPFPQRDVHIKEAPWMHATDQSD